MMIAFFLFSLSLQDPQEQLDALEKKVQELEKKQAQTTSASPLNLLNPAITLFGNFLWRLDDQPVFTEEGDAIDDTVNMREVEVDFRASIDPYADGVAIFSFESEAPGEVEVGVEEFYVNVKSLPVGFWERPPLGAKLKFGRFRTEFGRNNRLHLHDLPQSDRPLVMEEFLGEEGHIANGGSTTVFLPSPGETALELTLQAFQGGGLQISPDRTHPAYLANLRWFLPLGDAHSFDVSLIGFTGSGADVASVDFLYRWKPLQQGESRSVVVGGQAFYADQDEATTPFGYSAWGQVQLLKPLYVGVRWDQTDFLDDDSLERRQATPYVTYYLSEFFRARASFQRTWSDNAAEDGLDTFLLELNVIFGSHPAEPFWVNK
jgi:hypothetical protein